jgi:hypothetical protein
LLISFILKEEAQVVTAEEKLVAAKNEENIRIAAETEDPGSNNPTVIEQQLPDDNATKLVYNEGVLNWIIYCFMRIIILLAGQWSPFNKAGKKKYERDFLMQLQFDSQSLKRPDDLPKLEVVIDKVSKFT